MQVLSPKRRRMRALALGCLSLCSVAPGFECSEDQDVAASLRKAWLQQPEAEAEVGQKCQSFGLWGLLGRSGSGRFRDVKLVYASMCTS